MKTFGGKVAVVTGAGSGIGRALAVQLAKQGCHLALCDVNSEHMSQTVKLCQGGGLRITTAVVDVSDRAAVYEWAAKVAADHGKVNLVFNNAGVALGSIVEEMEYKDLEWIMGINFWGVVHGTMAFLPYLRQSGEGHVINISSAFGLLSMPGQSGYNASKFAVRGFTESLRMELDLRKANVCATSVHPGGIKTGIASSALIRDNLGTLINEPSESAREAFESRLITTPQKTA
jgi:NAD(P)-dependent dehydrogenase (short-subunit alcohol dehydrogenase family)